jgi:hypothetical protein
MNSKQPSIVHFQPIYCGVMRPAASRRANWMGNLSWHSSELVDVVEVLDS